MRQTLFRGLVGIVLSMVVLGVMPVTAAPNEGAKLLTGAYWRQQALHDLIPFWARTVDQNGGGYFTDVKIDGTIGPKQLKYPRMISRLVYGYSAAYLLSGEERYLELASHGMEFLKQYGWDAQYGGWFTELDAERRSTVPPKDLFDQTYGNLGPIIYYFATGDPAARDLVQRCHQLLQTKAWDKEHQGYFAMVNRDWQVAETEKSFNSQVDTATAYLIYYYLATRQPELLQDLKNIGDVIVKRMYDPETGYVRERFTRQWQYLDSYQGKDQIDIGHNLKTAWVLLRLHQLLGYGTEDSQYLIYARKIADQMLNTGWDPLNHGWYLQKSVYQPAKAKIEKAKCWWTQTEGSFLMLNLYHLRPDRRYLENFRQNAAFWDRYFVDRKYGEVYAYLSETGQFDPNSLKADLYKSAYHSMEHALMNYLYTQLYIRKEPVELYFRLSAATDGVRHFVTIVEDPAVKIQSVTVNGKAWTRFQRNDGSIELPKGANLKVKVVLGIR